MLRLPHLILPFLLTCASAAHADAIGHWSFDELSGTDHDTFPDTSGNPTKHNALVADKGQFSINVAPDVPFGKAISFTGKTGSYLDLPQLNIYNHSFTIAVWVYLNKADHNFVLADWSAPASMAYAFGFDMPKGNTTSDRITAWMRSDQVKTNSKTKAKYNPDIIRFTPATTIPLNSWHHVAWVWDQSATSLTIYLDGAKGDTAALYKGSTPTLLNNHRGPKIGLKQDTDSTFHGSMDELWVFNEALNATQLTALMKTNDLSGSSTFAAAPTTTTPDTAIAAATPPTTPDVATTPAPDPTTPTPEDPSTATPATPTATPTPPATPAATPTHETPAASPVFTTAAAPATKPTHVAAAPAATAAPDFFSAARAAAAHPIASPAVSTIAVAPHRYSSERMLGLIGTGALALTLSSFLVWATMERSRLHQHRR